MTYERTKRTELMMTTSQILSVMVGMDFEEKKEPTKRLQRKERKKEFIIKKKQIQ